MCARHRNSLLHQVYEEHKTETTCICVALTRRGQKSSKVSKKTSNRPIDNVCNYTETVQTTQTCSVKSKHPPLDSTRVEDEVGCVPSDLQTALIAAYQRDHFAQSVSFITERKNIHFSSLEFRLAATRNCQTGQSSLKDQFAEKVKLVV